MRHAQPARSHRRTAALAIAALAALPVLTACSSSGSDAKTEAEASASARASALGITPIPSLPPGPHGPNGDITAPATNAPVKTSPGGSIVFPNISDKQSKDLVKHLLTMKGVRSAPYYPQFDQLQVYFEEDATDAQKDKVTRYVTKQVPAAAGTSSPSPSASVSASASATE